MFETCYLIILSVLLMKIKKKETHIGSIVFFHSLDSSFCNFSTKILRSPGPRSEIILSSFIILWLCMIQSKQYILVKLIYSSKIIFFVKNLQRTCLFYFYWYVISIFYTWSLVSHWFINMKHVPYNSLIYFINKSQTFQVKKKIKKAVRLSSSTHRRQCSVFL